MMTTSRLLAWMIAILLPAAIVAAEDDAGAQRPDQWQRAFYEEVWTAPHAVGDGMAANAEAIRAFARGAAARVVADDWASYPLAAEAPMMDALAAEAIALREAGVDDPLVNAWLAWISNPSEQGLSEAAVASQGMAAAGYPKAAELAVGHALLSRGAITGRVSTKVLDSSAAAWGQNLLAPTLAAGDWPDDWERPIFKMVQARLDDYDGKELPAWLTNLPQASRERWLTRMIRAHFNVKVAWAHRGSGWANTVTEEGWAGFRKALDEAMADIAAAMEQEPGRSEPASLAITCQQGDDLPMWFEMATRADPLDNRPYYPAMHFAQPRWGGSPMLMLSLAERAVEVGRPDTGVPDVVTEILASMARDEQQAGFMPHQAEDVLAVVAAYVDLRTATPRPGVRLSDLASFGFAVAHHCERPVEAAAYLRQLGGDPDALITYPLYGVDKRWAPGAAAAAGEAALTPILAGVNADVAAGRYDEAIAKLTSFETGDAFVQMHLADRVKLAEWKRDFEAGRTLDLIGGGLAGWRPLNGNWSFDAEAKAVVAGFYGGNLRNVVGQPLGNRYELDLVVEVPEEWCQLEWTGVGFTWGYEPALATRRHPFAFAAGARGGSTWVSDPELAAGERSSIQPASRGPVISVRVRRDRQTVSIWTGDPGDPPDAFDRPADHVHRFAAPLEEGLGLSGYSQGNAAVTVRVTKLTVKKLDA